MHCRDLAELSWDPGRSTFLSRSLSPVLPTEKLTTVPEGKGRAFKGPGSILKEQAKRVNLEVTEYNQELAQ